MAELGIIELWSAAEKGDVCTIRNKLLFQLDVGNLKAKVDFRQFQLDDFMKKRNLERRRKKRFMLDK